MAQKARVAVLFEIDQEVCGLKSETLWAHDLGKDRYRLDNIPFLVYAISAGDIVYAPLSPRHGCPAYERVIVKSGNRTLRAVLGPPELGCPHCDRVMKELSELGCEYEGFEWGILGVNVPSNVSFSQVAHVLDRSDVMWEMADPDDAYQGRGLSVIDWCNAFRP